MLSHHQIAAAARIGMLTRERDSASACDQALRELGRALPFDAATLLTIDPVTGGHVQVAGIGYTAADAEALASEFTTTRWYRNVVRRDLPPSISDDTDDPGQRFRQGWFYAERVRPTGLRDGVTGALRQHGRLVGLVHLAAESRGAYDTDARRLLASVIPALSAFADPVAHLVDPRACAPEEAAGLVTAGRVVDLPGRRRPRTLRDETFRPLLAAFGASGGQRVRLLWRPEDSWYRVVLHRHRGGPGIAPGAVVVHETPTEVPYGLSPRELEVLTRAATGQTNQAIAQALFLSPRTVHSHVEHLLRKTGCGSRAEATTLAVRDGLLLPAPDLLPWFVER